MMYMQSLSSSIDACCLGGGDQDRGGAQSVPPLASVNTAPATAPISLETLFRNASLQQQTTNKTEPQRPQPFHRLVTDKQFVKKSCEHLLLLIYSNI